MSGKGDKPRNCFSNNFKDNYDNINWGKKKPNTLQQDHDEDHLQWLKIDKALHKKRPKK